MSATYNWAIRPGVTNKFGFNVSASADNIMPANCCYVALFGSDISGNGSRQYPFRTLAKAAGVGRVILAPGVYRENVPDGCFYYADGDVRFEAIYTNIGYGIQLWGINSFSSNAAGYFVPNQCTIKYTTGGAAIAASGVYGNIFDLNGGHINIRIGAYSANTGNNTFLNCVCDFGDGDGTYGMGASSIYVNCKINLSPNAAIDYSLFYNCQFSINGRAYVAINDLPTLLAAVKASFPTNSGFTHCAFGDPLFNNASIADYSLAFNSPAKNLSYFGTYVGAKSIAQPVQTSATEASGNFDFSTAVNLTINDNSLTITDTTQNSQIDSKLIANPTGRELSKLSVLGFTADRNGQYLSSFGDLATTTKSPSDTLSVPTPYLVETGAITYNGGVYQPGDRLTTVTGQTAFTTTSGGTLREIIQAPERHTIMARFSDGAGTVTGGTALTAGYWYYVESGSVTYNSVAYNAGSSFKAIDTNSFSGTGVVTLALSTESFQHYEPGIQPTSNNTGDTRTGSIIRGNGDPNYVRGGLNVKEFPINARFFQLRFILQVSNLKS